MGRSRPFWQHFHPRLQEVFPGFRSVSLDEFYRAINRVERSLIRIEADEVTYNLHVMLRFDLELDMLEGRLAVTDLPEAWNARIRSDFGLEVPNPGAGAMQDVHWHAGTIGGMFQGYTLGNIMSAQLFAAARRVHPEIAEQIGRGEFGTLHGWLRENVYQHGSKFTAGELIARAAGGPLSIEPYMEYLWNKYAPLYGLETPEPASVGA